jgi:hypothetical protein
MGRQGGSDVDLSARHERMRQHEAAGVQVEFGVDAAVDEDVGGTMWARS